MSNISDVRDVVVIIGGIYLIKKATELGTIFQPLVNQAERFRKAAVHATTDWPEPKYTYKALGGEEGNPLSLYGYYFREMFGLNESR